MKTAFDTNILIYLLENDKTYAIEAEEAISRALERGKVYVSAMAITEYLAHDASDKKLLDDLLVLFNCLSMDAYVAEKAGDLRKQHKTLRTPDAIHLATALLSGADVFVTNDKKIQKIGELAGLEIKTLA